MGTTIEELRQDLTELQSLQEAANRQRVKDILMIDVRKLQTEIVMKEEKLRQASAAEDRGAAGDSSVTAKPTAHGRFTKNITTYGWDQSEKFVKIYVTLNGVQNIAKDNVTCQYTDKSFKLRVNDLEGVDYSVHVAHLFENIRPTDSYHKIKTDMVLVMLKKSETGKTWAYVTEQEKKVKKDKPKIDENKDPNDSLMDMMKQMYDEGDDEMKRTIAKAWTESKSKGSNMDF